MTLLFFCPLVLLVCHFLRLNFRPAVGAVMVFGLEGGSALLATGGGGGAVVVDELGTDDACGDCHDGVAQEHDDGTEAAAKGGDGGYVAIAHGGHGDDCPVDAGRDVAKLCVGLAAFNHVHECAEGDDHDDDEEEEHHNLAHTEGKGTDEVVALFEETEEFEDTEDADETEGADYHQVAHRTEEPPEVEGKGGKEVDDAEKAEGVVARTGRTDESQYVLNGEEEGEDVLHDGEYVLEHGGESLHTLHDDKKDAEDDAPQQCYVKSFAHGGVAAEDDDVGFVEETLTQVGWEYVVEYGGGVHFFS